MIAIDDYRIVRVKQIYIKTIANDNVKVIIENKAYENYTACSSIIRSW